MQRRAHFLVIDLPHTDDAVVKALPAETTGAFCAGHNAAVHYFGGVPRTIVYDNTKLAVARIFGDGTRQRTRAFTELESHYLCRIKAAKFPAVKTLDMFEFPALPKLNKKLALEPACRKGIAGSSRASAKDQNAGVTAPRLRSMNSLNIR